MYIFFQKYENFMKQFHKRQIERTYLIIFLIIIFFLNINRSKSSLFFFSFDQNKEKKFIESCSNRQVKLIEPIVSLITVSSTSYTRVFTAESISKQILFQHWRETTCGSMSRSLRVLSLLVRATKHVCTSDIQ